MINIKVNKILPIVPTTICHVISTGAGSSTVVTSLTDTTPILVLLFVVVLAFLTPKLQAVLTVKEQQLCVTMFLALAIVKEGKEQQTKASIVSMN